MPWIPITRHDDIWTLRWEESELRAAVLSAQFAAKHNLHADQTQYFTNESFGMLPVEDATLVTNPDGSSTWEVVVNDPNA